MEEPLRSSAEILTSIVESIAESYVRPQMFVYTPEALDSLLLEWHSRWAFIERREQAFRQELNKFMRTLPQPCLAFLESVREWHPAAPSRELMTELIALWRRFDAQAGLQVPNLD